MADVYVYDRDCEDFASVGVCGRLVPSSCLFEEIANGMSELTLSHPIDDDGRYALLTPGRILKASVPVREVPEVDEDTLEYVTVVEKWYVRSDATKLQRTVFNKRDDQIAAAQQAARGNDDEDASKIKKKKLKVLKKGAKVTVVYNYGDMYSEYRVRCGKVTGYIDRTALRDKVTESYGGMYRSIDQFYDTVEPSWTCKDQLFRIYSVKRENDQIVVNARHIFYDLSYTLTTYDATGSHTLAYTLKQCKAKKIGSWRITFRTNIKGSLSGAHYRDKNMIEAILDPDDGMASRWKADVIRDNYDCCLIGQAGFDRGVVLEYGKDLLGVEYNVNWENIVTHIRPVGETCVSRQVTATTMRLMSPQTGLSPRPVPLSRKAKSVPGRPAAEGRSLRQP